MGSQKPFTHTQTPECSAKPPCSVTPDFSKDLWKNTKRRHHEARENMRHLLDRYVKPHH